MVKFWKDFKDKVSRWGKAGAICLLPLAAACQKEAPSESMKKETVTVVPPKPVVKKPVTNMTYVVDTLETPRGGALLFCAGGYITRYFIENNNSYRLQQFLLVHEQKHKDNYIRGLRSLAVSPEQYAKICMHDEISANIAQLLMLRYEYLTAEDKDSIFQRYEKNEFSYYFQAIKNKEIFPEKEDSVSRDAEWSFIMNKTRDMWMRRHAPIYQPSIWKMVERYTRGIDDKASAEIQNKQYRKGLKIAYNIGGVNFSKYMDKDVELKDKNFSLLDQVVNLKICKDKQDAYFNTVQRRIREFKSENIPINCDVVAQIYLAEALKSVLNNVSENEIAKNQDIVGAYYNRLHKHFMENKDFRDVVLLTMDYSQCFYAPLKKPDLEDSKKVYEKIYTYKGINLSSMISQLPKNVYNPLILGNVDYSFQSDEMANVMLLDFQLERMRKNSKTGNVVKTSPAVVKEKSRKSAAQTLAIPDFTQPILVAATPEDMQQIKQCIDDFYHIPEVMRFCNLKAQQEYLNQQSTLQR